ncbi:MULTISPECIES: hypothetical protein [Enterococcus]|uniref:hypothetical protein n=1 Tax=Enterococcus TaxID=1350 RepID=UPI0007EEF138|nr:hypothetical protein [Enterococcus mundtii]MBO1085276.1 hypothetical protein [Enterococcus mundtii]MDV7744715.1 hypothetical protein [Enterococcus mundtii]OBS62955.1 hypothetical protein AX758_09160 [Enterococcus mundtii]PQC29733.1 hypothetical protein CUM97_10640 [Enterococcus mundtii]
MELLEKETLACWDWSGENIPIYVNYAFFIENNNQGIHSHQQAILGYLEFSNRIVQCNHWAFDQREKTGKPTSIEQFNEYFCSIKANPLIYIKRDPDYLGWKTNPIYVNKEMMKAEKINPEILFKNRGIYEKAFFHETQTTTVSKEHFLVLNQRFFPEREHLKIYAWDTSFSNRFNRARDCYGAYLWSIYDEKRKRFTVISVFLNP